MKRRNQIPGKPRHIRPEFVGLIISIACAMALFFVVGGALAAIEPPIPSQKQQRLNLLNQQVAQASANGKAKAKNLARLGGAPTQPIATPQAGGDHSNAPGTIPGQFLHCAKSLAGSSRQ